MSAGRRMRLPLRPERPERGHGAHPRDAAPGRRDPVRRTAGPRAPSSVAGAVGECGRRTSPRCRLTRRRTSRLLSVCAGGGHPGHHGLVGERRRTSRLLSAIARGGHRGAGRPAAPCDAPCAARYAPELGLGRSRATQRATHGATTRRPSRPPARPFTHGARSHARRGPLKTGPRPCLAEARLASRPRGGAGLLGTYASTGARRTLRPRSRGVATDSPVRAPRPLTFETRCLEASARPSRGRDDQLCGRFFQRREGRLPPPLRERLLSTQR